MTQRLYSAPDADMLIAISTIAENALAAKEYLASKRPAWADPFFQQFQTKINAAFPDILGITGYTELKETTARLYDIKEQLLKDIAELKVQLKVDYKAEEAINLLNSIGIGKNQPDYKKKHEALVKSMQLFKSNLSPQIKQNLIDKGISPTLIEKIIVGSDSFLQSEIKQETLKGSARTITETGVNALNALYAEAIGIAKIARNFYNGQPVEQAKFSFEKLLRDQSLSRKTKATPPSNSGAGL